jgi:hypothetical protein
MRSIASGRLPTKDTVSQHEPQRKDEGGKNKLAARATQRGRTDRRLWEKTPSSCIAVPWSGPPLKHSIAETVPRFPRLSQGGSWKSDIPVWQDRPLTVPKLLMLTRPPTVGNLATAQLSDIHPHPAPCLFCVACPFPTLLLVSKYAVPVRTRRHTSGQLVTPSPPIAPRFPLTVNLQSVHVVSFPQASPLSAFQAFITTAA